jgi:hypothetical protein
MERLIDETMQIAQKKFAAFGFKEEQIKKLLDSGRRDLEKEIGKLKSLIEEENVSIDQLNQSLHALKGLLYNMGNTDAGDIMMDIQTDSSIPDHIEKIKKVLE